MKKDEEIRKDIEKMVEVANGNIPIGMMKDYVMNVQTEAFSEGFNAGEETVAIAFRKKLPKKLQEVMYAL